MKTAVAESNFTGLKKRKLSGEFYEFFQDHFPAVLLWTAASKYVSICVCTFLIFRTHHTEELFNIWVCRSLVKEKYISEENIEFGLRIWITLQFTTDWRSFGQRFIISIFRYFTGVGFENTLTTNLDYFYYILQELDFKILRLRIWILIVIYLTGFGLENTSTSNLGYEY